MSFRRKNTCGHRIWAHTPQWRSLPLLQLKPTILKCQHLVPRKTSSYLHQPHVGYYRINLVNCTFWCHICNVWCRQGKTKTHTPHCWSNNTPFSSYVCWSRVFMFASSDFGIAQSHCVGLHVGTEFAFNMKYGLKSTSLNKHTTHINIFLILVLTVRANLSFSMCGKVYCVTNHGKTVCGHQ